MGALWMLVAGLLFGCMGVFVKLGARHFSDMELVFWRSFIGLLVVYAIARQRGGSLATPHWRAHLWRGISGTVALMLFFYCITVLPLATAVTLNYTAPLFLTLLTVAISGERLPPSLAAIVVTGFIGVILLLHPSLEKDQVTPGLLGLVSGFLAGIAYLNVKQLGKLGEPEWRVVFYFSLTASLASGIAMLLGELHPPTLDSLPVLLGLGASATLAQLAMTSAYRTGKTLVVGSLAYSTVVFASLFGILLWNETLPPSGWAGMALIIVSGVIALKPAPKH